MKNSTLPRKYSSPKVKSSIVKHYYENWVYDESLKKYMFRTKITPKRFVDIGEPACFRCGYYPQRFIKHDYIEGKTKGSPYLVWNKADFLERCHIIPSGLGGGGESDNIVLLCHRCHSENPNTKSVKHYQRWMDRGKSDYEIGVDQINQLLEDYGYGVSEDLANVFLKVLSGVGIKSKKKKDAIKRKFKKFQMENVIMCGAHKEANMNSFVVSLIQFCEKEGLLTKEHQADQAQIKE